MYCHEHDLGALRATRGVVGYTYHGTRETPEPGAYRTARGRGATFDFNTVGAADILSKFFGDLQPFYDRADHDKLAYHIVRAHAAELAKLCAATGYAAVDKFRKALFVETARYVSLKVHAANNGINFGNILTTSEHLWRIAIRNFGVSGKQAPNAYIRTLKDFLKDGQNFADHTEGDATKIVSSKSGDDAIIEVWGYSVEKNGAGSNIFDPYYNVHPQIERLTLNGTTPVVGTKTFSIVTGMSFISGTRSGVVSLFDAHDNLLAELITRRGGLGFLVDEPQTIISTDSETYFEKPILESVGVLPDGWQSSSGAEVIEVNSELVIGPTIGGSQNIATFVVDDAIGSIMVRFDAYVESGSDLIVAFHQQYDAEGNKIGTTTSDANMGAIGVRGATGAPFQVFHDGAWSENDVGAECDLGVWTTWEVEYSIFEGVIRRLTIDGEERVSYQDSLTLYAGQDAPCSGVDWVSFVLKGTAYVKNIHIGGCNGIVRVWPGEPLRLGDPGDSAYLHQNALDVAWRGPRLFSGADKTKPTYTHGFYLGGPRTEAVVALNGIFDHIRTAGVKLTTKPPEIWEG